MLKFFGIFTEKHQLWSLILIKFHVWSPEDCCKTYLTSMMELFLLRLNHILKTYLIGCIFYTIHFFAKKNYNCENFWRKSLLLRIEKIFLSKFEIMQWNAVISKEGFLNYHRLNVSKPLHCFLLSLFQILWSKQIFKDNGGLLIS